MAEKLASIERLLNCPVCGETFTEPASLSCKHSFCSECLQNCWEKTQSKNCPLCQRRSSKDIMVNFALKQLADSFAGREWEPPETPDSPATAEEGQTEFVCSVHNQRKMFCQDDQKALCTACEFPLHENHKVVPLEEAVRVLKEQLNYDLKALKHEKKNCEKIEHSYQYIIRESNTQLLFLEMQTKQEFEMRRQALAREEESRVGALRERGKQKLSILTREMEKVRKQVSSLSSSITAVEKELQKAPVAFLKSYKASKSIARDERSKSDPHTVEVTLKNVNTHLGNLSLTTGRKMDRLFTLNPSTAGPSLHGSSPESHYTKHLHFTDPLTHDLLPEPMFFRAESQNLPDPLEFTKHKSYLGSGRYVTRLGRKNQRAGGDDPKKVESEAKSKEYLLGDPFE